MEANGEQTILKPVVEASGGQKAAGWTMRVFGLLLLLISGAHFVSGLVMLVMMPAEFRQDGWVALLIWLGISLLVMVVASLMGAFGAILCGGVQVAGECLAKWCSLGCLRDMLIMTGAFLLVAIVVAVFLESGGVGIAFLVVGGFCLGGGMSISKVMAGIVRQSKLKREDEMRIAPGHGV